MFKLPIRYFRFLSFLLISLAPAASAWSYSPEQTAMAWVTALKRNDVKAALLLGTTPEEYLKVRADLADEYKDTPESNTAFAAQFNLLLAPEAEQRIFALVQPLLSQANNYRGSMAGLGHGMLEAWTDPEAPEQITPEQAAAALEVLKAFENWAGRTDFSDPARAKVAINAVVTTFRAANVRSARDWAQLSDDARISKLNYLLIAIKAACRAYDLNLDNLLGSINATPGTQSLDHAEVRIAYKVFEARGSSKIDMYQRQGEWFFWQDSPVR